MAETKDWTWVLEEKCPQCGGEVGAIEVPQVGALVRATNLVWRDRLSLPDAAHIPGPEVWSAVGYACHVRDVHILFRERLELMLTQDNPTFPDWNPDAAAAAGDYLNQDPAQVVAQLISEAEVTTAAFDAISPEDYERTGLRSNGTLFTVRTLAQYYLHDVQHHVYDVTAGPAAPQTA